MKTADIWFPREMTSRNDCRNSILMTCHYPDLGRASDWSFRVENSLQPIRSNNQVRVVTRHQNGISALDSPTSFRGETSGCVAKCRLFSQAILDSVNCRITCNTHRIFDLHSNTELQSREDCGIENWCWLSRVAFRGISKMSKGIKFNK